MSYNLPQLVFSLLFTVEYSFKRINVGDVFIGETLQCRGGLALHVRVYAQRTRTRLLLFCDKADEKYIEVSVQMRVQTFE